MPELYLMRHAKAKQARGDMTDHQRPLSRRGERQAAAMAQALRGWNALSGEILVSSAQRTRETLEGVEAQLSETLTERAAFHDTLYTFDKQPLLEWLRERPAEVERVLIIGHNPALETLARWLCRDAPESLPTGGMLHISLPDVPWQLLEKHSAEQVSRLVPAEASHALFKKQTPKAPDLDEASLSQRILGLLNHYYRRVRALEPGVIAGLDPEFLHQYRVNLRRSRAIGESLQATTKVPGLKKALKRLKRRAQATSDLRDLDVFLESLRQTPPPLAEHVRNDLVDWLNAQAEERHAMLCRQLAEPDYAEDMRRWEDVLASKKLSKALRKLKSARVEAVLADRIARHDCDLGALTLESDDAAFHELRKTVKRIRYLAELDPVRNKAFLAGLKRRQTLLGDLQDMCTRQAWVQAFIDAAGEASERRQACADWLAALEAEKQALREEIIALEPLARAEESLEH
ncbi:CHAD domain-containing protein [Aidingimonas halophila]|uniref:Phosphohistidine phosphatase n=1 Tax=Aidingimonas halophila TaxID=574349 RepID=A0A1H2ZWE9_9GAMM|nr:CHAD domain-containing protein [Aidingimonas halophila]GHC16853.1 hypothetical protein GCM10008094_02760 [Aidingimonas halophila]SDX21753.1 phosphohistidine phosphatase [Aidingimonas halophila]